MVNILVSFMSSTVLILSISSFLKDYNPKLCDFGMITGGIFPDRTKITSEVVIGCYGYIDPHAAYQCTWSLGQDVFTFGTILLSLISKRVYTEEDRLCDDTPNVNDWAWDEYDHNLIKCSLSTKV
ncbi:probable serine/threonine-protein kinase PBL18 [Henckelia pumila]|uniref:probable serine/threonine-protein kinase PBL18 n=1 Tax=Henckelia pumila TaxID=405737 RepID=UPI003C6E729E